MDSALTKHETYLSAQEESSVNQLSVIFSYELDTVGLNKIKSLPHCPRVHMRR